MSSVMMVPSAAQLEGRAGGTTVGSYVYVIVPPGVPNASSEVAVTEKPPVARFAAVT